MLHLFNSCYEVVFCQKNGLTQFLRQLRVFCCPSLSKATNDSGLKGGFYMLPWHAIPFLKGLGMLTPNPWENGWPHLWRSCNWQKNTQLNHSMAPKEPYRESEWADVSPLLKYISGASPEGPEGAVSGELHVRMPRCPNNAVAYLLSSLENDQKGMEMYLIICHSTSRYSTCCNKNFRHVLNNFQQNS